MKTQIVLAYIVTDLALSTSNLAVSMANRDALRESRVRTEALVDAQKKAVLSCVPFATNKDAVVDCIERVAEADGDNQ